MASLKRLLLLCTTHTVASDAPPGVDADTLALFAKTAPLTQAAAGRLLQPLLGQGGLDRARVDTAAALVVNRVTKDPYVASFMQSGGVNGQQMAAAYYTNRAIASPDMWIAAAMSTAGVRASDAFFAPSSFPRASDVQVFAAATERAKTWLIGLAAYCRLQFEAFTHMGADGTILDGLQQVANGVDAVAAVNNAAGAADAVGALSVWADRGVKTAMTLSQSALFMSGGRVKASESALRAQWRASMQLNRLTKLHAGAAFVAHARLRHTQRVKRSDGNVDDNGEREGHAAQLIKQTFQTQWLATKVAFDAMAARTVPDELEATAPFAYALPRLGDAAPAPDSLGWASVKAKVGFEALLASRVAATSAIVYAALLLAQAEEQGPPVAPAVSLKTMKEFNRSPARMWTAYDLAVCTSSTLPPRLQALCAQLPPVVRASVQAQVCVVLQACVAARDAVVAHYRALPNLAGSAPDMQRALQRNMALKYGAPAQLIIDAAQAPGPVP
jgi:hypothetical protein